MATSRDPLGKDQDGQSARLIVRPKSANPLTSAPPVQPPVEIVDRTQRFTVQQIRAMDAAMFAKNMKNPAFVREVDALFNDR